MALKGTGKVYGKNKSLLKTAPLTTALGTAAVASGGALGAYHLLNRDRSLTSGFGESDPFFGPGGYNPDADKARYEKDLYEGYGPGIFEHNKKFFGSAGRREELQKAVAEGRGGGNAYRELRELNREHSRLDMQRQDHLDTLDSSVANNERTMQSIADRKGSLENQRTAWWAAPKRWLYQMQGKNPTQEFDAQIGALEDAKTRARLNRDLAQDRSRLVGAGATRFNKATQPTSQQLQDEFFPSYR